MKMNQKLTVLGTLVLGVLLAGFNVKAADAPALQGKFTLTSATRWSYAMLPAGDYSFTLNHDYAGSVVTIFHGTQRVAQVQTPGISRLTSGPAQIVMQGGAVRDLNLPVIGVSLNYPTHNRRMDPREQKLAQTIAVSSVSVGR